MRTLRVLTSDKLTEMNNKVRISDVNVIERGQLKIQAMWANIGRNIQKIEKVNDSSESDYRTGFHDLDQVYADNEAQIKEKRSHNPFT